MLFTGLFWPMASLAYNCICMYMAQDNFQQVCLVKTVFCAADRIACNVCKKSTLEEDFLLCDGCSSRGDHAACRGIALLTARFYFCSHCNAHEDTIQGMIIQLTCTGAFKISVVSIKSHASCGSTLPTHSCFHLNSCQQDMLVSQMTSACTHM